MDRDPFLLVIGAGSAGNACGRTVARAGKRVVTVEHDRVGGLCLWAGCMPKKALYSAASSVRALTRMEQWGISCGSASVDWDTVLAWKWHSQETYAGDQEGAAADAGIEVVHGHAHFVSPGKVNVNGVEYEPENILIATGSQPVLLDVPGRDLADTSREALSYPTRPDSLAIVGSGFIAMEMAGIFASFGTEVAVIMRGDRPLGRLDPDIVDVALDRLGELGVEFVSDATVTALRGDPGALHVDYETPSGSQTLSAERVLAAIGRRPALGDIRLAQSGLATDDRGRLLVHDHVRTSDPHVLVAGDSAGGPQFTPAANEAGAYAAAILLGQDAVPPDPGSMASAVFTEPQLGFVGMTEKDAADSGISYTVKRMSFEYVGAAIIADDRRGLVKLIVGDDDRLLGAHIAGPSASDLIYPYSLAMRLGATTSQIAAARAIHPAFTEAVNWTAWR